MKASSDRTRTSRRAAAAAVVGLGAVALLGGCGFDTRQQAAAVVNGHMISQNDVAETVRQLKDAKFAFSEQSVVMGLVASPLLKSAIAEEGGWEPNATYAQAISLVSDPTQSTKDFVAAAALFETPQLSQDLLNTYQAALKDADIEINPRFGSFELTDTAPLFFQLGRGQGNWIKPNVTQQ